MSTSELKPIKRDAYRYLAPVYDALAQLVFRGAILKSQIALVDAHRSELTQARQLLWIGGGTGRLLNQLCSAAPEAQITYVEPSAQMLRRAQSNLHPRYTSQVRWVHQDHRWALHQSQTYDAMITAFFLDVLPEETLRELIHWAQHHVKTWLFADFVPQRAWYARSLIWFMYLCFAITTRIEQRRLLNHQELLISAGWTPLVSEHTPDSFAGGLIEVSRLVRFS